ncbi:hypothetical protein M0802_000828 [Mischocyttarus mexicanus]|nr:hypothetical protein M0802_000828 [Mischocyttarus mexicanus]
MSRVKGDIAIKNNSYQKANGILFICICFYDKINSTNCEKYNIKKVTQEHNNEILTISDHSKIDTVLLKEEISKLKMKTFNLDMMIQKMNKELNNVQVSSKKTHLEMADFVSESVGGSVISTPDTESYFESKGIQFHIFGIPIWRPIYFTPRKIIQPWSQAGECWAFHGSHGKVVLELAILATISHVTIEHIPVSMSLTGRIDSAPRKFIIFGYFKDQYILIDTFEYNIHGSSTQTFLITKRELLSVPFKRVMLEILSNWGNQQYTCIYRFKIHGKSYE